MFKVVVLVSLAALALGAAPRSIVPRPDGRIIGGQDADIKDYPYQLSLIYGNSHICGASILSSKWAVTAAHCTDGFTASNLRVRAASSSISTGGQVVQVSKVHQNKNYNSYTIDYDISLLELQTEITLGSGAAIITPADEGTTYTEGATATVTGWGYTSESGPVSSKLQVVTVPFVTKSKCSTAYATVNTITDRMLCAGYDQGGKDACSGDSGGPLVINGKLAGIVSWGVGCARKGYPGVYANVPNLRAFIRDTAGI